MSEWISVDDRLPETFDVDGAHRTSKSIVVLHKCKEKSIARYEEGGKWAHWYCEEDGDILLWSDITHWVELPDVTEEQE